MKLGLAVGLIIGLQTGPGDAPPEAPDAVDDLAADTTLSQRVELSWTPVPYASEYKIYRATASPVDTGDTLVATVSTPFYEDTGLSNGTEYFYAVAASNISGDADLSNEVSETPVLTAPTNLVVQGEDGQAVVSWDPVPGATGYDVVISETVPPPYTGTPATDVTSPYTYTGLTNGTIYYLSVRAKDGVTTTDPAPGVGITPVAAPTASLSATADGALTFTWPASSGATQYDVYFGTSPNPTTLLEEDVSSPYEVTGLDNNTTYYFRVRALNVNADSGYGTQASGTPRIAVPENVATTWEDGQVTVSWDPVPNAIGYDLFRALASPVDTGDTELEPGASTSYEDSGRSNGTEYFYAVRATDGVFNTALSSEVSETPLAPPANLAATPGNEQNSLSWDAVSGATAYDLFVGTSPGITESDTEITGVTSPHVHSGLTNGTTYYYKVRARNATGQTALSSEASGTPVEASAEQFPSTVVEWNDLSTQESIALGDPSYIWLFDEASGNVTDEVSALTLTAFGTLAYSQTPSAWGDQVGIDITVDTTDRFQGATTDLDIGTGSWFAWIVCEFVGTPGGANRTIVEKFASGVGYTMTLDASGFITLTVQDGTNTDTLVADASSHIGTSQLIGFGRDVNSGEVFLFTAQERITAALSATGNLNNSGNFRFGRFSSAGMEPLVYSAWWFGAEAEGVGESDWDAYATYLGI